MAKNNLEFLKHIKALTSERIKKLNQGKLQQLYERALIVYPDSGGQISRKERQNLFFIQAELFGGVDTKLKGTLENIGETLVKKPEKRKKAIDYNMPSAGSVIVKSWKDKQLEVKILEDGFEYEGMIYSSLSKLAKEVAGYAVSGPIFFGLRKAKAAI